VNDPNEPTDNLEAVRRDIIALAQGLKFLNDYGSRLAAVESICIGILAPSPVEARAQEDLASLHAGRSKNKGPIVSIVTDWDDNWHFIFQFRFTDGYWQGDGFDLREGEPGFAALLKALEVCKIDKSICDLTAPEKAGTVPSRRIIYPKATQPKDQAIAVEAIQNPLNK